jgi:precorrin-6Y C5,15-methyltransferase (decarboxylating)
MTSPRIHLIGVAPGAPALSPEIREVVASTTVVAGAERHLRLVPDFAGEVWSVEGRLSEVVTRIGADSELRASILASGDPGFFGVAGMVLRHVPADEVRIWPAVSSMQLAFARAGETWSEARFASLHGRPLENLAPVLGAPKVGLFTDPTNSPAAVARFLLETGWGDVEMVVAEDLGLGSERVRRGAPDRFVNWEGSSLSVVLLLRQGPDPRPVGPGLPESSFSHSRGLITKREVRAVALALLNLPRCGVLWDVGAGSGSVAAEACLLAPGLRAYAVEKTTEGIQHVLENRRRLRTAGLVPIRGEAPEALAALPDPDAAFLGGSGGHLAEIATHCWQRVRPGGTLVVAAVLLDTLCEVLVWARESGLEPTVTEVRAARSRAVAARRRLDPQNAVTLVRVAKISAGAG